MRRRKNAVSQEPTQYALLAAQFATDAELAAPGSNERQVALQKAIFAVCQAANFSARDASRKDWITTLRLLSETTAFPSLGELARCLEALDRGQVDPRLEKALDRNSKRTADDFEAMRALVMAATELRQRWGEKDEVARSRLRALGLPHSTFAKYRKQLEEVPDFAPRSYLLAYGTADPKEILRLALSALK